MNDLGSHPHANDEARRSRVTPPWHRLAGPRAFFWARFSPHGYLGLHLTIGVLLLIGASWLFGGIAEDVMTHDPSTIVDHQVAVWFHQHAKPGMTSLMEAMTFFGSPLWVAGAVIVTALVLWRQRCWYRLLALAFALPGGLAQIPLMKFAFHRSRPHFTESATFFAGYSFPSGHAMAATLLYGLLGMFAVLTYPAWGQRLLAILGAVVMILLVAFSRVYLGAHYLSDVLGAMAAGFAWLALTLTAVDAMRRRHGRVGPHG